MASDSDDLEAQLKRENPKGRLWERCAQLGVSAPRVRHRRVGDRHQVELVVDVDEWELSSGAQWAWSRKMAEQLAARELLEELDELRPKPARTAAREDDDVFDVDEDLAERLRSINPKGRAFEWTQRQKPPVARPRFEARREGSGMLVRARLDTLDLVTPWFRAGQRKLAEQAAAQALLPLLEQMSEQVDARTVLNELVQKGDLLSSSISVADSGLDLEDSRFRATAQLVSLDGSTTLAEAVGRSKRDAASKAARALLDCRAAADGAGPSGQWHASAMARARPAPPWWQTAPFVFVDEDGTTLGHARSAIGVYALPMGFAMEIEGEVLIRE